MLGSVWFTAGILGTILAYTWYIEPRLHAPVAAPAAIVLALALIHAVRARESGLAPRALIPGTRAALLWTLPFAGAFLLAGWQLGTLHDRPDFFGNLAVLIVWGGAQQWVLQTVILRESQGATTRRAGIVLAAALFASVHLPNPFLSAATLLGALGWCAIYDRYPNILPLALAHALATLAILYAFTDPITGRLRIGMAYLR